MKSKGKESSSCKNDLYMDYKSDIITKEQYFHFKQKYADKIVELESRYNNLNEELMHSSIDDAGENSFVEAFKKYKNITTITRDVIVELIKMIYVERNGSLRIEFNFKDAFEDAVELLSSKIETGFKFDVELMDGVKVV